MAKKSKNLESGASRVNKTQTIKDVARELLEKTGSRPRPQDIVRELEAKGIDVKSPQVSQALAGTELAFRQKRGAERPQRILPDPATAIRLVSLDDLIAARDYVGHVGTLDKAIAALVALKQLGGGEAKTGPRALSDAGKGFSSEGSGHDRSPPDDDARASGMRKVV